MNLHIHRAADAATCAAVLGAASTDALPAPRATFHTEGYRVQPGFERDAAAMHALIDSARLFGDLESAARLHEQLMRELMQKVWDDVSMNVVTTVGKADLLDKYFAGSAYTAAWYCGLISSVSYTTGPAAGDTAGTHGGWTEAGPSQAPNYTSGTRPQLAFSAASGGSKTVSAPAAFTFSGAGTIKGLFTSTVSTKDGTTGILYNAVLFTGGDRVVAPNDVVNVSPTYTIT